ALESCYQNKSIYEVFYLKSRFDLDDVENFLVKIKDTLATLNLGSIDILKNFTILSEADKDVLKEFANSGFADINFDEFK
ncbi:hypothetical protein, partial [Staphylococcus aureus]|uniref:hypothetical protein n=1 Tax=Staphylococcus aureus TaxID=1280 RepID=UPI0038B2E3B5